MNIYALTLYMFLLTFAIGFVVAFIIKISVRGVEFSQVIRDEKYHNEMKRLRSIRRIRKERIMSRMHKIEDASNNKLLDYYHGKSENESNKEEKKPNELINHFYGNRDI